MLAQDASDFYNQIAGDYHLIFKNWEASVRHQGEIIDKIIQKEAMSKCRSILDCSCGIGTQAIGLALCGYEVEGTDISSSAIERAKQEAGKFGVEIPFKAADFLTLGKQIKGTFDAVISFDNSLPHLLTDEDLLNAAENIGVKLNKNGLFMASIRDYDAIIKSKPSSTPVKAFNSSGVKHITFQTWEWPKSEPVYIMHMFMLKDNNGKWEVTENCVKYRALERAELTEILEKAGFSSILWHMPKESGYYQPIVTAHKA